MEKIKNIECVPINWPAPKNIHVFSTTKKNGMSVGSYFSFNLATHVGDDLGSVLQNRALLRDVLHLPNEPQWLNQIHSDKIIELNENKIDDGELNCDASFSYLTNKICVVLTADCVPLLMTDKKGSFVAAVHAGWKGLALEIIPKTIQATRVNPKEILVWIGPAISQQYYSVQNEVIHQLKNTVDNIEKTIIQKNNQNYLNLIEIAKMQCARAGVIEIYGGDRCTFEENEIFYSYRREQVTGRMAHGIWKE